MQNVPTILKRDWHWLWASFLALGWLLPPYPDFARDAFCACVFLIAALALLGRARVPWALPPSLPFCLLLLLLLVPLVQWVLGLIYFAGVAWMSCAYLAGFAMALWCGHHWECMAPGRGLDALFAAIGVAALVTVCMQCLQWLGLVDSAYWWLAWNEPQHPAGNFDQRNIAATFVCWGLCAVAWAGAQRRLGYGSAAALAAFLLWGVALTGSRTAWVGLTLVLLGTLYWRRLLPSYRVVWLVLALAVYFVLCVVLVASLHLGADQQTATSLSSAYAREQIWRIGLKALASQPLQGFGWGQIFSAQLAVADLFPPRPDYLISAHNLVLDLLLWNGALLGAWAVFVAGRGLLAVSARVCTAHDMVLAFFVVLALNHAMLELPLQYATMLLPLGWVLGALQQRTGDVTAENILVRPVWVAVAMAAVTTLLVLIVTDYVRLERYTQDKLQLSLASPLQQQALPELYLLTHLRATQEMERYPSLQANISLSELERLEAIARWSPQNASALKVAGALAMNGQAERARWWLARICTLGSASKCSGAKDSWAYDGRSHPEIAAIDWP